jgi:hypothetical protein
MDKLTDIGTEDILKVLMPLWTAKPETASRLRRRMERVFDFARARGKGAGENLARWRGHLDAVLPKWAKLTRGHHKAMPCDEVPAFMTALRERAARHAIRAVCGARTQARQPYSMRAHLWLR